MTYQAIEDNYGRYFKDSIEEVDFEKSLEKFFSPSMNPLSSSYMKNYAEEDQEISEIADFEQAFKKFLMV